MTLENKPFISREEAAPLLSAMLHCHVSTVAQNEEKPSIVFEGVCGRRGIFSRCHLMLLNPKDLT